MVQGKGASCSAVAVEIEAIEMKHNGAKRDYTCRLIVPNFCDVYFTLLNCKNLLWALLNCTISVI